MKEKNIYRKKILLGITGGIAAYKTLTLISLLRKSDNSTKVILTKNAEKFVTVTSVQTLSKNKPYTDMFDYQYDIAHIDLTEWADALIVAPATANIIGKFANGIADDLLSTTLLAFDRDIFIAPAMNTKMYKNTIVQRNIRKLRETSDKIHFLNPASGLLACGAEGVGRMAEPEAIMEKIAEFYAAKSEFLLNRKIIITAGPTREYIDPVRYISNDSSGMQGFALAQKCADAGADVLLISGPASAEKPSHHNINFIDVTTAAEMFNAVQKNFDDCSIFISCAAVADFSVKNTSSSKIKKSDGYTVELCKNSDILEWCGANKENRVIIGFAAETDSLHKNALQKLKTKNCDFIVANPVKDSIGKTTNKITIIDKTGNSIDFPEAAKDKTADYILDYLKKYLNAGRK